MFLSALAYHTAETQNILDDEESIQAQLNLCTNDLRNAGKHNYEQSCQGQKISGDPLSRLTKALIGLSRNNSVPD